MQSIQVLLFASSTIVAFSIFLFLTNKRYLLQGVHPRFKYSLDGDANPWVNIPDFVLYLRLTSGVRWEEEYNNVLIRTLKLFVPNERAKLLVALDNEKPEDHRFGDRIGNQWPYPDICYLNPSDKDPYRGWSKARMFLDMMYPDKCTQAPYVGFIDTDTFFSTLVTPQLLFEQGKPIIVAKIGLAPYSCWEDTTEIFLGKKEVMQCMSTFPVMIKTEHMREMRNVLSKQRGIDFDSVFKNSAAGNNPRCICQFSIMCNYVWYYHREEYSWHLQMVPDGDWTGVGWLPSQVPRSYYETVVKPEMKVPIPRTSIHLRYTLSKNGKVYYEKEPPKEDIEEIIKEGLCFSAGFDVCPAKCSKYNSTSIHYSLFSFELYQWFWDPRCKTEQDKHYANVRALVDYYVSHNLQVFGLDSIDKLCDLI